MKTAREHEGAGEVERADTIQKNRVHVQVREIEKYMSLTVRIKE
jgi:hypothetical protein